MEVKTVLIHGYSDCSESFVEIKNFLLHEGIGPVQSIYYADYESREDNLTFDDAADGLHDEFMRLGFIDAHGKKKVELNVVVHSTGGLVIRHWLWCNYLRHGRPFEDCPVRRLVMLAPANFGSPLAHRGKSFLGSLVKGRWKVGDFLEVGRQVLEGLELGSPFQWELAHHDLLSDDVFYRADRLQVTILVGADDYTGIAGWVNKPGTDGTVVIAGTSLDTAKLRLDCCVPRYGAEGYEPFRWSKQEAVDEFGFAVLPGYDHGSIVNRIGEPDGGLAATYLLQALRVQSADEFKRFITELDERTKQTYAQGSYRKFQQYLVHCLDDQGEPVRDFTLDFHVSRAARQKADGLVARPAGTKDEKRYSEDAAKLLTSEFHQHTVDPSYRRFLFAPADLDQLLKKARADLGSEVVLSMRVHVPAIDRGIQYDTRLLQNIVLVDTTPRPSVATGNTPMSFAFENTTTLLELRVNRFNDYVSVGLSPRKH